MTKALAFAPLIFLLSACATVSGGTTPPQRRHQDFTVLDTHIDTPVHFARPGWHFGDRHDLATDLDQIDLPRMHEGGLDGGFFAIFTPQGPLDPAGYATALASARKRSDEIDSMLTQYTDQIGQALTPADAFRLDGNGRFFAFRSIENSYPLGTDLSLLREFFDKGVRLAGPVHSQNNQFADSSTDTPRWNGLSPLGRQWVKEMNRLGIVIDASHASNAALDQMLELSNAPILLSHSTARAAFDHPRNLDDAHIRKVAAKGGAICVSTIYLSAINLADDRARLWDESERLAEMTPEQQADVARKWRKLDKTQPLWQADFDDFMQMMLHVIKVAGVEHVCVGADWDGGGGLPGLEDATSLPKITQGLRDAGYSDKDIEKIWSGNVLRVLKAAQDTAVR
ncbi:dipeptidase [Novosphingobium profundi]|uniref:dipeptidase n=1 Tax=Novosphingobium profundi TaxID=1774954 RepID=UPI001CFDA171|nr:dipeptidase [Novosphingobium profundi]